MSTPDTRDILGMQQGWYLATQQKENAKIIGLHFHTLANY
jgi:hypothetical protein